MMRLRRMTLLLPLAFAISAEAAEFRPDSRAVLAQAREAAGPQKRGCRVDFKSDSIAIEPPNVHARVTYAVGEDCAVRRESVVYSTYAPVALTSNAAGRFSTRDLPGRSAAQMSKATYGCTVNGWEEDVVAIRMIQVQNHTTWTTDHLGIVTGRINALSQANLDWWHLNGPPDARIGLSDDHHGSSLAQGAFYCAGSNFCRSCQGDCGITLVPYIDFDSGGNCSGGMGYFGEVVPAGRLGWEIFR